MTRKVTLGYDAVMRLAKEAQATAEEIEKIKKYFHNYDPYMLSKMPDYEKSFTFTFPLKYKPTPCDYLKQILSHINYIEKKRKEREEVKEEKKKIELEDLRKEVFQNLKEKYSKQIEILEEKIKKSISPDVLEMFEEEGLKPPVLYYLEKAKDLIDFVLRVTSLEKIQEIIKAVEVNIEKAKQYVKE